MKPVTIALLVLAALAALWWLGQMQNRIAARNKDLAARTKEPEPLTGMVKVPA